MNSSERNDDFEKEIRTHLELEAEDQSGPGISEREARDRARRAFGNAMVVAEDVRAIWHRRWLEDTWQDLRYGLRMLRKSPGFTAIAVITLALGIGANTAIFSIVNGVLLNPLPYPNPDQLVTVDASKRNFAHGSISYPNFTDWHQYNRSFSYFAAARGGGYLLTGVGEAEELNAALVTSDFFPMFGIKPALGRWFTAAEDVPGASNVVAISFDLWQRKFRSSPEVIGSAIALDGKGYTIVGVLPAHLDFPRSDFNTANIFVPLAEFTGAAIKSRSAGLGIHGVARMKPGVSIEQARADLQSVAENLARIYPDVNKGTGATLTPLKNAMVGGVRSFLLLLLGAVGLVLLIACVNVANLLLARGTARNREMAVRAALGAGTARLIRQMLTESIVLAGAGGLLGLALARAGTRAALSALPATLPRAAQVGIDSRVLWFTLAISLFAGIVFGIIPALRSAKRDVHETLKGGGRGASGTRHRAQNVLVAVQMAMALVLLIGAGLLIRSLAALWQVDPGFDQNGVILFNLTLPPQLMKSSPASMRASFRDFISGVAAIPGVQSAAYNWGALPMYSEDDTYFWIEGRPKPASNAEMYGMLQSTVGADYLRAMHIPLLKGRFFTEQDNERSKNVVVVDQELASKYFPNGDAVGSSIHEGDSPAYEIIGVVGHVKQWGLDTDDANPLKAQVYFPIMQVSDQEVGLIAPGVTVVVRTAGNPPGLMDSIRSMSARISRDQLISGVTTLHDVIEGSLASRRFTMMLLGAFATIALLLAGIGLYGVIAYVVGQRTNEIGIRMALGAHRNDVLNWVLKQGLRLALVGVAIGMIAAALLTRFLTNQSLLFRVSARDPLTFAAVAAVLLLVALAACVVPAWRAAGIEPITALRHE